MNDYPTNLTEVQCSAILEIINDNRKRNHSLRVSMANVTKRFSQMGACLLLFL